jgi:hypothetical protein
MKKILMILTLGLMVSCGPMGGSNELSDVDTTVTSIDTNGIVIDTVVVDTTNLDTSMVPDGTSTTKVITLF